MNTTLFIGIYVIPALTALVAFWLVYSKATILEKNWLCIVLIGLEAWFPFGVNANTSLMFTHNWLFQITHNAFFANLYAAVCLAIYFSSIPRFQSMRERSQYLYFGVATPITYLIVYVLWVIVTIILAFIELAQLGLAPYQLPK